MSKKLNRAEHGENNIKNSYYWEILIKKYGNLHNATKAVKMSRYMVDPTCLEYYGRRVKN